ncbi:formate dehydrogenase accessory sulfurtransferase FdhD [Thermus scotoductus]|uniref:formate dehydrogenase accessory sulfurtransferase FdhD n=1 Tax=Thermus scotoductus TaxID=37636 RepID=UPI00039B55B4|nr:formate dehydrogenase accessory sulfurtransferase FdhD [Thermus scotoductus]
MPKIPLDPELPLELMAQLHQHAVRYAWTRGIHGAALFDLSGQLLYLNEDIGRHNAVDRLAGYMLLEGVRPPVLLAVTATAPAVSLAQRYGLALAAYVRPTGYRLYAPGGMPVPEGVLRP